MAKSRRSSGVRNLPQYFGHPDLRRACLRCRHREHRDPPEPAQYDSSVSACFGSANGLHREILVRIAPEYRCFALGITIDALIGMAAREDRGAHEPHQPAEAPGIITIGRAPGRETSCP